MANVDGAFGLALHEDTSKTPLELCFIASGDGTATFIGDAVKLAGSAGNVVGCPIAPTVIQAAATDPIYGVVMGFMPHWVSTGADLSIRHRKASTAMYALVKPANHQDVYRIQSDADGGNAAATDVGLNADLVVGAGNAITGMSAMELDTSTKNTAAGLQVKIVGIVDRPDNAFGTANVDLLVRINQPILGAEAGSAGV